MMKMYVEKENMDVVGEGRKQWLSLKRAEKQQTFKRKVGTSEIDPKFHRKLK